ncbi:MAG: hypothetical protein AB2A00_17190 [Myxococcota bacterium]
MKEAFLDVVAFCRACGVEKDAQFIQFFCGSCGQPVQLKVRASDVRRLVVQVLRERARVDVGDEETPLVGH